MGTQQALAQTMREPEADDGLALTGHQGTWPAAGARRFAWAAAQRDRVLGPLTDETHPTGHGREARRRPTVTHDMAGRRGYEDGGGLHTVAMVEAWRPQGDVGSAARRDSSRRLGLDAQRMAESVRGHGAMEHALHGGLDSAFREDESRLRTGHAPEHFALLRPSALHRRTPDTTTRPGVQVKRHRAGWDHDS